LLKLKRVNASYGDVQILFDIDLEVKRGEFICIVGANAAGKSTLLRSISGLIRKVSGSIELDGQQLIGIPPYAVVLRGIVHIPEGRRVFPLSTVSENLELGGYVQRKHADLRRSLQEMFDRFPPLYEHRNQLAGSLSGGEQQMLAIARGLMARPTVLIVDEPSLGLAPMLVERTFQILQEIHQEGVTVILAEQNVTYALKMCDRAYVLENGRIVMSGEGGALLKDEHLKRAYLGM
jgi:branched-chain amino acid transport system ATP-binding protein